MNIVRAGKMGVDIKRPENAKQTFYIMFRQAYSKKIWQNKMAKTDTIITELPSAPNRNLVLAQRKRRTVRDETEAEHLKRPASMCKMTLNPGGYVIFLADFFMLNEWMVKFCGLDF